MRGRGLGAAHVGWIHEKFIIVRKMRKKKRCRGMSKAKRRCRTVLYFSLLGVQRAPDGDSEVLGSVGEICRGPVEGSLRTGPMAEFFQCGLDILKWKGELLHAYTCTCYFCRR